MLNIISWYILLLAKPKLLIATSFEPIVHFHINKYGGNILSKLQLPSSYSLWMRAFKQLYRKIMSNLLIRLNIVCSMMSGISEMVVTSHCTIIRNMSKYFSGNRSSNVSSDKYKNQVRPGIRPSPLIHQLLVWFG